MEKKNTFTRKKLKRKKFTANKMVNFKKKIAELQGEGQINKKKTPQNYEEKIVKCMLL